MKNLFFLFIFFSYYSIMLNAQTQKRQDYSVEHDFKLTPGGNVVPKVATKRFAHAWVLEKDPDCSQTVVVPGQGSAFGIFGMDKISDKFGIIRNSGLTSNIASVKIDSISSSGILSDNISADAIGSCQSSARAISVVTVLPFNAGTTVEGTILSLGNAIAIAGPNKKGTAYAFSMTSVEAQGGSRLSNGSIKWNSVVRDIVSGSSKSHVHLDPIDFALRDSITGDLISEGTLLSIAIKFNGQYNQGFIWDSNMVSIDVDNIEFSASFPSMFTTEQGNLYLKVVNGKVVASNDVGYFNGILPPVGTVSPLQFSMNNEITFNYDLQSGNNEVTLNFNGNGEASTEVYNASIPTLPQWALIIMSVLLLTVGIVYLAFGKRLF